MDRLPRSVRERLGEAIVDRLLLLCRADDDEDLPARYHEWAARPRGVSERWVLQQSVDSTCATLGAPGFEVTPTQVMAFKKIVSRGCHVRTLEQAFCPSALPQLMPFCPKHALCSQRIASAHTHSTWGGGSGAIAPGEVSRLRNLSGYVPISWMEARSQLHSVVGLMGALTGTTLPAIAGYLRFLRQYNRLFTRLENEIDQVYGRILGPSLVTFHVQLAWRNWLVVQLDANETGRLDPPGFTQGLNMLEVQNNLMWLPTVTNIPALSVLRDNARPRPAAPLPRVLALAPAHGSLDAPAGPDRRDPGRQVRNPSHEAYFIDNTPLARNVRTPLIAAAIATAGTPPPEVTREGVTGPICVSWHAKGQCLEHCLRVADHEVLSVADTVQFQAWCAAAYV
jgi:hypothetical protein